MYQLTPEDITDLAHDAREAFESTEAGRIKKERPGFQAAVEAVLDAQEVPEKSEWSVGKLGWIDGTAEIKLVDLAQDAYETAVEATSHPLSGWVALVVAVLNAVDPERKLQAPRVFSWNYMNFRNTETEKYAGPEYRARLRAAFYTKGQIKLISGDNMGRWECLPPTDYVSWDGYEVPNEFYE